MVAQRELDFGMKCIKYMLCIANLMFVLVGLLLISIGYTIKNIYTNFEEFMETYYHNPATLAVVVGFFIFIIALFGCVGAFKESTFLVNTYAFLLSLALVLQISVSIAAYASRTNMEVAIRENMKVAMDHYDLKFNAFTWNATQYNLQCCGVEGPLEWNSYDNRNFPLVPVSMGNKTTINVPTSCCLSESCIEGNLYMRGCLSRLTAIISQCALLLAIGALCVSMIQVLGIVFAYTLAKAIRKLKTQELVAKEQKRRQFYNELVHNQQNTPQRHDLCFTPQESEA